MLTPALVTNIRFPVSTITNQIYGKVHWCIRIYTWGCFTRSNPFSSSTIQGQYCVLWITYVAGRLHGAVRSSLSCGEPFLCRNCAASKQKNISCSMLVLIYCVHMVVTVVSSSAPHDPAGPVVVYPDTPKETRPRTDVLNIGGTCRLDPSGISYAGVGYVGRRPQPDEDRSTYRTSFGWDRPLPKHCRSLDPVFWLS